MGALAKLLAQPTAAESSATTEFDGDGNYVQARVMEAHPETPDEILSVFGHDPDKFCVDGAVTISHRELTDGRILSTYRYRIRERPSAVDIDDLIVQAEKAKKHRETGSHGPYWFVYQAGDLQIGKRSRDGATEEIVSFFLESVNRAVEEFERLAPLGISGIQLCFPGDCL